MWDCHDSREKPRSADKVENVLAGFGIGVVIGIALVLVIAFIDPAAGAASKPRLSCPGLTAHVTLHDYDGPYRVDFCVDPGGFQYTGSHVYLTGGDPTTDGIFRSGFEVLS